jgi:hypothetical protein
MLDPELSPATGPSFRGQLMAQISSAPVIGIAIGAPGPAYPSAVGRLVQGQVSDEACGFKASLKVG